MISRDLSWLQFNNRVLGQAKKGGGEIVDLMGTSAWYAPGAAAQMVEAIALDQNRIFPVCAHIDEQYGIEDLYIGVPVKLGKGGIKEIIEVELTDSERDLLHQSAGAVRGTLDDFRKLANK